MRKKTSVAFLAVLGLLLFGCGKKTTTEQPTTKTPTPVTTTAKPTTKKEEKKFTVTVNSDNQKAGTIEGVGQAVEGSNVTLTAKPNQGYTFLGFYDGANKVSDGNSTTYTISNISKDVTLTAKWAVQSFTLTVNCVNEEDPSVTAGSVTYEGQDVDGKLWETDTVITLTATPLTGYQFNGWYLVGATDPLSTDAEYDFHMLGQNTTLEAHFGVKQCTIEVVASDADAIKDYFIWNSVDDDEVYNQSITVNYGTDVQIGADANNGYEYVALYVWNEEGIYDPADKLDVDYNFTATDSVKFYAVFDPLNYVYYVYNNNRAYGKIEFTYGELEGADWDSVNMAYNSTATVTATAYDGYSFIGWYADGSYSDDDFISDSATYTLKMICSTENWDDWAEEETIYALFAPKAVTVNVSVDTVDGEGNPVATATINGDCEYGNKIYLKYIDLDPAYDYVGVYTKVFNEETQEYDYVRVPGTYHYANGFEYTISSLEEVNLYFVFELGERTTFIYTNIEELNSQIYEEVVGHYGDAIDKIAPTIPGYTFAGWYDDTNIGWNEDADGNWVPYILEGATPISTDPQCPFTNIGYDGYWCWYTRNLYKVEYTYSDGVNIANDQTWVEYGLKTQLELPTYTGYAFQYWYYNSDVPGEGQVILTDANAMMLQPYSVAGNVTLRAKWLDGKVVATFDTDGGSTIDPLEVQYNHPITRPADPEKDGYKFEGWFNADGQEWVFNQAIVENTTLYAHWSIRKYTIALESQDDTIVTVNNGEIDGTYEYHTKLQLSANVPDGYTFAGWYDEDILVLEDAEGEYTLQSHNVVLVAKFTVNEYTVTVRYLRASNREFIILNGINTKFSANGEYINGTTATYDYKTSISVQSTLLSQYVQYVSYYSLNGTRITSYTWSSSTSTVTYNFVLPAEDVIIEITVAHTGYQFGVNKNITEGDAPYYTWQYNSSHYTSASSWSNNSIMYLYAPNVTGYQFDGWYNGTTLVTTKQNGYAYTHAAAHETLTAKYSPLYYNVFAETVVDSHTGSDDVDDLIDDDEQYTKSYTVTTYAKTGYSFLGWYDVNSSEYVSTDLSYTFTMPHDDVYLQAIYEINSYGMNIQHDIANTKWNELMPGNSGHGDVKVTNESYDYNTEIEFEITTNPGWKFKGIYGVEGNYTFVEADKNRLSDFEELLIDENATTFTFTVPATDYSFFVLWEANKYNVAYITNGGTLDSSMQTGILFGIEAQLKVPVWEGGQKDFVGWLYQDLDEAIEYRFTEYDGLAACYNIPKNIQLQAIWGQHLQDITFEVGTNVAVFATDTKTFIQKVPNGGYVNRPEDPVKKGHTFLGWYTTAEGDVQWDFDNLPVTEDKTIYAHWEVNSYEVVVRNFAGAYRGYFTYYVNDDIQGTVTSNATFTIPFGSTLKLHAYMYVGWKISRWEYWTDAMGTWTTLSTKLEYDYTLVQDVTTKIDLMYTNTISSMSNSDGELWNSGPFLASQTEKQLMFIYLVTICEAFHTQTGLCQSARVFSR